MKSKAMIGRALDTTLPSPRMRPSADAYRPDIDGLRAIAVTAVLLFHAVPQFVPGGYVGVDIFFVLSGFLITGLLLQDLQQRRFSVLAFYVRRARRLFPALLAVLLTVLVVGWAILLPSEFEALGKHVFGGAAFISNVLLWREAGYFDSASEHKVLLHLWSLGMEEQYYLLWPLCLWLLFRRAAAAWWWVLAVVLGSFVLSLLLTPGRPAAAFYLPFTRFWELLTGSLLAWRAAHNAAHDTAPLRASLANAASVVGLAMLALAIGVFDRQTPFPGWAAAMPVIGTVLLAGPARESALNRRLLSSRPFVWIGLISYPLYLWHWPLLAFARIWQGQGLDSATALALVAASVALAWLTYRFIERPVRRRAHAAHAAAGALGLWVALIALGFMGGLAWSDWLLPRSADSLLARHITQAQKDWSYPGDRRVEGDLPGRVLFIGDSHMQEYWPSVERLMNNPDRPAHTIEFITEGGCAPFPGVERRAMQCHPFALRAFEEAAQPDVKTVVFAVSWYGVSQRPDYHALDQPGGPAMNPFSAAGGEAIDGFGSRLRALRAAGKRVVVVTSSPRGDMVDPARLIDRRTWGERTDHPPVMLRQRLEALVGAVDDRIREVALSAGAELINPFDELCTPVVCTILRANQEPAFLDESHLRASFVRERVHMFDDLIYGQGPTR
jgi:peptidoglycan/LPS O-acetylase OafA/YrhL